LQRTGISATLIGSLFVNVVVVRLLKSGVERLRAGDAGPSSAALILITG
jgi:hypothetical protein